MAALSENMLAVNMLLSVFFLPGVMGDCGSNTPLLFLTIPNKIEALSGSCLLVPCSFRAEKGITEFNSGKETRGAWIQSKNNIYDIDQGVNTDLAKITGNLRQRNCTTVFSDINKSQEDKYFLRIENGGYKATACSTPLHITVQDSPWSPSINIPADLKEHQSVTISCSALTPCPHSPPELTWNLQKDSHRQTEKNTEGTFTTKIQENITLSDTHDGYNISCSATYPVNGGNKTAETEVTLSVSYAPKDTSASISPSGLVSAGSWVELNCSSRAKPSASFSWFRNSKHGAINVSLGQVYSFNVTDGGEYYCVATNDLGQGTSSVILVSTKDGLLLPLLPITVGISVALSLIVVLVVSVWCCKYRRSTPQQTQSQRGVDVAVQVSDANPTEGELHYGDLNFTQKISEASSGPVKGNEQQETVYSQVKVSGAENSLKQSAESPENLYAQVMKR
ncbi:B-cell receptor CD22-like [Fundulus heteroclitus]|uniref:B-cell receptor CD22-like n=1 Tax=Fundulus heteroclitus TaxID=8078 RepID=UPI00165A7693|nr:B-cell receptor CD22-like [Fundulus heteroclitus]